MNNALKEILPKLLNNKFKYCSKYDSYYSKENAWIEEACDGTDCWYDCKNRPEKHLETCECLKD
jgi:hypothetical protein